MTQRLYAEHHSRTVFNTSGWTEGREQLADEVFKQTTTDILQKHHSEEELAKGVCIGTAEYDGGWTVTLEDKYRY